MSTLTITVPASELSLLSIAELREAAGVSDGSKDASLLRAGRRVSSAIARACCIRDDGIHSPTLLRETCEERFEWVRDGRLRLARRPVTEIVSITSGGVVLDVGGFTLNKAAGIVTAQSGWGAGEVVVIFVAGFVEAPEVLKDAATRVFADFRSDTVRDPNLKKEDIPGVISREYWISPSDDPLISREVKDLIAPFAERWI